MVVYRACAYIELNALCTVSWKLNIPLKPLTRSMSPEIFMKPGNVFLLFIIKVSLKLRDPDVP